MTSADLNSVLWRERELLESLLFFLEIEQLILASGRTRWLPRASAEIERTTATLRTTELLRAAQADEVAAELGLAADPSLNGLARAAAEPWATIFEDQREAFVSITTQIADTASANRAMLAAGQRATREALLALSDTSPEAAVAPIRLAEREQ